MKITFRDVEKKYDDFSLKLDLEFPEHSFVSILGPSGSGKTTTLNLIAGIEKPDSGSLYFGSRNVTDLALHKRNLGMVFQDYALFPHMDMEKNISYALRVQGTERDTRQQKTDKLVELLHLEGLQKRNINNLSGGEQQRAALARAIASEPEILLLDEPLSSLDAELRLDLRKDIRALQRRFNMTAVYVTHDQLEAFSLSDKILLMMDGECMQFSEPEELYSRPVNSKVAFFLGFKNIIDVSISGSQQKRDSRLLDCRAEKCSINALAGEEDVLDKGICMFRPESCIPAEEAKPTDGQGAQFTGEVKAVEYHGSAYYAEILTDAGLLKTIQPRKLKPGEKFTFFVPADKLLVYKSSIQ